MLNTETVNDVEGRKVMFQLTTHSTHFIYGYMALDIWLRTILIVRKYTRCRHMGYSFRLTARVLLYAPSHRQDSTYHGLCYTSRGALAEWGDAWSSSWHASYCTVYKTNDRLFATDCYLLAYWPRQPAQKVIGACAIAACSERAR